MGTLDYILTSQHVASEGFPASRVRGGGCSGAPWEEKGSRGPPVVRGLCGLGGSMLWGTELRGLGSCL